MQYPEPWSGYYHPKGDPLWTFLVIWLISTIAILVILDHYSGPHIYIHTCGDTHAHIERGCDHR